MIHTGIWNIAYWGSKTKNNKYISYMKKDRAREAGIQIIVECLKEDLNVPK